MFASLFDEEIEVRSYDISPESVFEVTKRSVKSRRPDHGLCGIVNQGATCYLNCLLQTLYFTKQFKERLFAIRENELGSIDDEDKKKVRVIPLQLQRLFAHLYLYDADAVSTTDLTNSFGWNKNEHIHQHDVQELNRILFSAINDSLVGTSSSNMITSLYHGSIINRITCDECEFISQSEEDFLDITLTVQGNNSVEKALHNNFVKEETLDGANRYRCSRCGKLVKAIKASKIKKLPEILTLSLLRFSYDFKKGQRFKETSRVSFPPVLDMSPYVHEKTDDNALYSLYSVVVHRGGAYGGHYHAYIRDTDCLGHWELKDVEINNNKEIEYDWQTVGNDKSCKNKHNFMVDKSRWFNINDAVISPVLYSRIETSFSGKECAYMMFYERNRSTTSNPSFKPPADLIPQKLQDEIQLQNEQLNLERAEYETHQNTISITFYFSSDFTFHHGALQLLPSASQPTVLSVDQRKPCRQLLKKLKEKLGFLYQESYVWQKLVKLPAGFHLYNVFQVDCDTTVQHCGIQDGCWILLWDGLKIQDEIVRTGESCEPIFVMLTNKQTGDCLSSGFAKDLTFAEFKMDVSSLVNIPTYQLNLTLNSKSEQNLLVNPNFSHTLNELQLKDNAQIIIEDLTDVVICDDNNLTESIELSANFHKTLQLEFSVEDGVINRKNYEIELTLETTVAECLQSMLKVAQLQDANYHLKTCNLIGEACSVLDDTDLTLEKANIKDGDTLLLCHGMLPPKGSLKLKISLLNSSFLDCNSAVSGVNEGSGDGAIKEAINPTELGNIVIFKLATLEDLKKNIIEFPELSKLVHVDIHHIRLQVHDEDSFRILKGNYIPLRNLQLSTNSHVFVKILPKPENLGPKHIVLKIQHRCLNSRTYCEPTEHVWDSSIFGPTIESLTKSILDQMCADVGSITIAKYIPNKYDWLPLCQKVWELHVGKKKKKRLNLKQSPFSLKDGDLIGVKDMARDLSDPGDFSTDIDDLKRSELERNRQLIQQQREQERKEKHEKRTPKEEVCLSITVNDFS